MSIKGELDDVRKVRISTKLMAELFTRDAKGYRLRVDWGEPDVEGFYDPTIYIDYTDCLLSGDTNEH